VFSVSLVLSWQRLYNSLSLQFTDKVFFSQPNYISCHFFSITMDWHLQNSTQFSTTPSNNHVCRFITPRHGPRRKHSLSIVDKTCLLIRCLEMDVLLLSAYASAVMYLWSCYLVMDLYVIIYKRTCGNLTTVHRDVISFGKLVYVKKKFSNGRN
jgi:hypothetical protein